MTIAHHPPTGIGPATAPPPAQASATLVAPTVTAKTARATGVGGGWDERPSQLAEPDVEVVVRRLDPHLPLPAYAHPSDAGADLVAAEDVALAPGERAVVGTGLGIALPEGYAAFVHPRSGLAARYGLTVVNAPGTVDAGYRGEIKVILLNTGRDETLRLRRGDRIAQLVIQRVERAIFREVDDLPDTVRGSGGFGSTGGFADVAPDHRSGGVTGAAGDEGDENTEHGKERR